ncbi:MAG: metal ABC transporter substrate-binding protein [Propionibacteriaceae bacterium]|nr:metal ABC transporter substrate-binding protein [Propionibacteriaceae bacterium]
MIMVIMFVPRGRVCSLRTVLLRITTIVLLFSGLTGCVTPPPAAEKPVIVVGMYPLEFIAREVAGPLADIRVLIPPGVEPHDYELTPTQTALLLSADLVFYQSGVSAVIDTVLTGQDMARVVDTATLVAGLPSDSNYQRDGDANPIPGTPLDPHTWMNPANMSVFTTVFTDRLVELLPANTTTIGQASQRLIARLGELDSAWLAALTNCERREFLTAHDAFRYLASAYNLTQLAIAGINPEDEPTPAHLAEVSAAANKFGITTVFYEPLVSRDALSGLANDLGLQLAVLDPLEAITDSSAGNDYLEVMYANMEALRLANGCK